MLNEPARRSRGLIVAALGPYVREGSYASSHVRRAGQARAAPHQGPAGLRSDLRGGGHLVLLDSADQVGPVIADFLREG